MPYDPRPRPQGDTPPTPARERWNALAQEQVAEQEEARAAVTAPGGRPEWQKIGDADDPFARLMALDAHLVAAGFHPMSPWWRETLRAFYAGRKRWLVVLAGRGSGKSTTLIRVAVAEALFTPRKVPTGQTIVWPFVSVHLNDSKARIEEIRSVLVTIGVEIKKYVMSPTPRIETEDANGNNFAFVALAGTVTALSGPTTAGTTLDEEQKMRGEGAAHPAAELLASVVQTFRANPDVRAIRCSSAWSAESTHAAAIRDGDTDMRMVARLGAALDVARAGFLEVAAWEEARGDRSAAEMICAHAATLTARSPEIPTWAANPVRTALDYRKEVEELADVPGGLSRVAYWMRENGSVIADGDSFGEGESGVLGTIPSRYAREFARRRRAG
jgi:hypothetical protein